MGIASLNAILRVKSAVWRRAVGWAEPAIPIGKPPILMGIASLNAILRVESVVWRRAVGWVEPAIHIGKPRT